MLGAGLEEETVFLNCHLRFGSSSKELFSGKLGAFLEYLVFLLGLGYPADWLGQIAAVSALLLLTSLTSKWLSLGIPSLYGFGC